MNAEDLIWELLEDARVDVERAVCWYERAEQEENIAHLARIGRASGQDWIDDELEAASRKEWQRVEQAERHYAALRAVLLGEDYTAALQKIRGR